MKYLWNELTSAVCAKEVGPGRFFRGSNPKRIFTVSSDGMNRPIIIDANREHEIDFIEADLHDEWTEVLKSDPAPALNTSNDSSLDEPDDITDGEPKELAFDESDTDECPECGGKYDDRTKACGKCRFPFRPWIG